MTDKTKLLKMVEDALQTAPNEEAAARAAIYAVAEWFDEMLQVVGITPSSIPTMLRWQANQHEYLNDDSEKTQ